jgi:FAD synthase
MRLPHVDSAVIPPDKLRDYLLSPTHPVGRYKAAFLRSQGYEKDDAEVLARDIRSLLDADAMPLETTHFGTKYMVSGTVTGPRGREFGINTVWIILNGEYAPRFVTAYPKD